jgi:hypothetical protein
VSICLSIRLSIGLPILAAVGLPVFLPVERRVAAAALSERQLADANDHQPRKNIRECLAHHSSPMEFPKAGIGDDRAQSPYQTRRGVKCP